MKSVHCAQCGFVQAERARCGKCGHVLGTPPASDTLVAERGADEAGRADVRPASEGSSASTLPGVDPVAREAPADSRPAAERRKGRKPKLEPIPRIRSLPLTVDLDFHGGVLVEFRCGRCESYGVLPVPAELMPLGIEGECGSCRRVTPLTRVELEAKRMDAME